MDDEQSQVPPNHDAEQPGGSELARDTTAVSVARAEKRKAAAERRRARRIRIGLAVMGAAVLALFLSAIWPIMQGRLDAAKRLDQAIALLEQANGTMSAVDKTVAAQLSPEAAAGVADVSPQLLVARRELNQAIRLIDDAKPRLTEDEQNQAALMRQGAKARLEMADAAPAILAVSVKAVRAKALGDQGWQLTQRASASEDSAVRNYRLQKASAVESAAVAVPTIDAQLASARQFYSQAATAFPDAGFISYVSYVDMKRKATAQLGTAARQWLAGNRPGAEAAFVAYKNATAKSAVALKLLPTAPGNATGQGFRKLAGAAADRYARAKKQAHAADRALKNW